MEQRTESATAGLCRRVYMASFVLAIVTTSACGDASLPPPASESPPVSVTRAASNPSANLD